MELGVGMNLLTLKKEGWFDDDEELDIRLNDNELQQLRKGFQITVSQLGSYYTIQLKHTNLKNLTKKDIIIRKIMPEKF
jgi:hypothetical protein